jgi:hypothetical protein
VIFDTTTYIQGNAGDFITVLQRGAGLLTLPPIILNSMLAPAVAPYLSFAVNGSGTALDVYVVGDGVNNYLANLSFITN